MIKIKEDERGLKFIKGEFVAALKPGKYWIKPFSETRIDVINVRETKLEHKDLDFIWRNKIEQIVVNFSQFNFIYSIIK